MDTSGPSSLGLRADGVEREYDRVYNDGAQFGGDLLGRRTNQFEAQDDDVDPIRYTQDQVVSGAAWLGTGAERDAERAKMAATNELRGLRNPARAPFQDVLDKARVQAASDSSVHGLDKRSTSLFDYRYKYGITRSIPLVQAGELKVSMNVAEMYLHLFAVISDQPVVSDIAADWSRTKPDPHPLSSTRLKDRKKTTGGVLTGLDVTRREVAAKGLKPTPMQKLEQLPMIPTPWAEGYEDVFDNHERLMSLVANNFSFLSRFWKRLLKDVRTGELDRYLPIPAGVRAEIHTHVAPSPDRARYFDTVLRALGFHARASTESRLGIMRVKAKEHYGEDRFRCADLDAMTAKLAEGRHSGAPGTGDDVPIGREELDPRKGILRGGTFEGGMHARFPDKFRGGAGLASLDASGGPSASQSRFGARKKRMVRTDWTTSKEKAALKAAGSNRSGKPTDMELARRSMYDGLDAAGSESGSGSGVDRDTVAFESGGPPTEAHVERALNIVRERDASYVRDYESGYKPMHNSLALGTMSTNAQQIKHWPRDAVGILKAFSPIEGAIACCKPTCKRRFDKVTSMKDHVRTMHPEYGHRGRDDSTTLRTRRHFTRPPKTVRSVSEAVLRQHSLV